MKAMDLALAAARKRQSPRTGFAHLFYANEEAGDTIPIYENFCFVLALLEQKKAESVLEGKDLLLRLLAFQTKEGNFPVYLHEFPRSYNPLVALKVGPLLFRILQDYGSVLGAECRETITKSLQGIVSFAEERKEKHSSLWKFRSELMTHLVKNVPLIAPSLDVSGFSSHDWWEYWVGLQWLETPVCPFFDPDLEVLVGPFEEIAQEGFEPAPHLIEWMICQSLRKFPLRLAKDHADQLQLPALRALEFQAPEKSSSIFPMFWKGGSSLHTLVCPSENFTDQGRERVIELNFPFDPGKEDCFEISLFCDASSETALFIEGKKGSVFRLGEKVSIVTPGKEISLSFSLLEGEGDFCGHIFRGKRPGQRLCNSPEYGFFDWKISLRTLRRTESCKLAITVL